MSGNGVGQGNLEECEACGGSNEANHHYEKKKMESIKKEGDGEDKEVKRKRKRDLERVRKKET